MIKRPLIGDILQIIFDFAEEIAYNMLNREADTIVYTYPFPAKILVKNSTFTLLELGCYFLFFMFRMATISKAKVSMICNSSYVLIKMPPSF